MKLFQYRNIEHITKGCNWNEDNFVSNSVFTFWKGRNTNYFTFTLPFVFKETLFIDPVDFLLSRRDGKYTFVKTYRKDKKFWCKIGWVFIPLTEASTKYEISIKND